MYIVMLNNFIVLPVDCGSPQPPVNGMVTDITNTLEGSEVTFQCGNATATAVCSKDGRWSPDPGQQVCGFQSGMNCLHHLWEIRSCIYMYIHVLNIFR